MPINVFPCRRDFFELTVIHSSLVLHGKSDAAAGFVNALYPYLDGHADGQTITYDAAGNPLSYYNGQSYTFTWEDCNQLASAVTGGKTVTFEYNSDGIRTEKHVSGTADYYYRLSGSKVMEMASGALSGAISLP